MRYFRLLSAAVVALSALGVAMVDSASATLLLPEVVITLTGATYPIHLRVTNLTAADSVSTETEQLSGKGILLFYLGSENTSLGTFAALTEHFRAGERLCNSVGDPGGEVLAHGTWHLVYTSLNVNGQPLGLGVLHLVSPLSIECENGLTVKIRGSVLWSVAPPTMGQLTQLTGSLTANGLGNPTTPTAYYNDEGQVKKARLEANFGAGFGEAAEEVGTLSASLSKSSVNMYEIEQPNP